MRLGRGWSTEVGADERKEGRTIKLEDNAQLRDKRYPECYFMGLLFVVFFKQMTAYEISL